MAAEGDGERLVVLGCGFGGYSLLLGLPGDLYDTTLISPRNYFLFTPLLASAVNGTVELRSILEPVRRRLSGLRFVEGSAERIDWERRTVRGRGAVCGEPFEVPFDLLVVAVGAKVSDYGIPGVAEHTLVPASVEGARAIRRAIQEQFARAELPGVGEEERRRLLTFVVCGGGPTGVEVAAEIQDLIAEDLRESYPGSAHLARVVLLEATERLLSSYDEALAEYTREHFRRENIDVRTRSPVVQVRRGEVRLADGSSIRCGRVIWAGGNGPLPLTEALAPPDGPRGRIPVDDHLRLPGRGGVWAIGDCAACGDPPLPATAQVAQQQGKYLAKALRRRAKGREAKPFHFRPLGMLAYIGGHEALVESAAGQWTGRAAWILWRSVYLTKLVSPANKVKVLFDWVKARLFGRDISRF